MCCWRRWCIVSALQDDLRRAGIEPYAWVINGSLAAAAAHRPFVALSRGIRDPQIAKVSGRSWQVESRWFRSGRMNRWAPHACERLWVTDRR